MHIISAREFKAVEIDYSSENVYNVNQAQVKVPDSLLKRADLIGTYEMTYRL